MKANNYNNPTKKWSKDFKLLTFTYPIRSNHQYYKKRKFMLVIFYQDKNKKFRSKKIFFGFRNTKNMIDDPDFKTKREIQSNLFHPYFWQHILLNKKTTLQEAYASAVKQLIE